MTCAKHMQNPARGYSPCVGCEIENLHAEIERLRATLDQLLRDAQTNGFIGANIDDAIAWAVRQMAEAHRLRREIQRRADLEPGGHVLDDDLSKAGVT